MKLASLFLTAALLAPTAATFAQSFAAATGAPAAAPRAAGTVTYFGTVPSNDAAHEQFARLRQAFAQCQPTVVFFENPDMGTDSTEALTIAQMGPAGYARFLAQQHQVPTQRLDDVYAEYAYLQTQLAPEPLGLYWLLRQTQQFQHATGASRPLMVRATAAIIASNTEHQPGTAQAIGSVAALQTAFRKYCPAGGRWWALPAATFAAQPLASSTGPAFLADITRTVNQYRAERLAAQVAAAVQAGQRVLVVMGRDYLPAPAQPAYAAQTRTGR